MFTNCYESYGYDELGARPAGVGKAKIPSAAIQEAKDGEKEEFKVLGGFWGFLRGLGAEAAARPFRSPNFDSTGGLLHADSENWRDVCPGREFRREADFGSANKPAPGHMIVPPA